MSNPSPSIPGTGGPQTPGLTPEQLAEIALATQRSKKISRAVTTARVDGGITATFAILCLMSVCLGWENLVLGIIFSGVAVNSFRGAKKLKNADISAPAQLALNQLILGSSIILYAAYSLYQGLSGSSTLTSMIGNSDTAGLDIPGMTRMIYWALYGTLIIGTIIFQGLTAIYYITRKKYVQQYIDQTPAWVIQLQAART